MKKAGPVTEQIPETLALMDKSYYITKLFKCIVLLLTLSTPLLSYAQNNYKPGYAVDLKNDTLKGYINYREWRNNPKSFIFKSDLNGKATQKFSVNNSKAFGVTNLEYYQRFDNVQISKGNVDAGSLTSVIDTSYYTDTVFLKVITVGKNVSLYSLSDNVKIHYFIEDNKHGQVKELDYFLYLNNNSIQTVYAFRKQLTALALNYKPGNTELIEQAERADYSESDIKAIVYQINGGENLQFQQEKPSGLRFFAGAGVKANKLTFRGDNGPFPDGTNRSSTFPVISGGADFIVNKNTNKIIFRAEVMVTDNKYDFSTSTPTSLIVSTNLKIKQLNVLAVPQVIYNFYSANDLKAFFDAGIAFNFSFYNNYNYVTNYFDQTTETQNKYPQFEKAWPSFPLKAGLMIGNKLEIYATYWFSASIISNLNYSADISSYQLGLNYMF